MSIKTTTPLVTVTFGKKAKIGAIIGTNNQTKRPILMLAPIIPTVIGSVIEPETAIKEGETVVILEFVSPKSIDVIIEQLEKLKLILIKDYAAKLGAELHNKLDAFANGTE